jgi:hypothetical protein
MIDSAARHHGVIDNRVRQLSDRRVLEMTVHMYKGLPLNQKANCVHVYRPSHDITV